MSQSSKRYFQSRQTISNRAINGKGYTQSSHFISSNQDGSLRNVNTRMVQYSSNQPQNTLNWQAVGNSLIYRNGSDLQELLQHKNILLDLIHQFQGGQKIVIQGKRKDDFNKRLLLLENQIDGLLRRKIMFESPDHIGGTRSLDYTGLLNQKENQIIQLEKKIQNLQQRMRRMTARQTQLENQVVYLNQQLRRKNQIIQQKDKSLANEVAYSKQMSNIIQTIKRSNLSKNILQDLVLPSLQISDIKSSAKRAVQSRNLNNDAVKLIRQFENAGSRQGVKFNTESIIQGFILGLPANSPLRMKLTEGEQRIKQDRRYVQMQQKFSVASDIYKRQLQKLKVQNPGLRLNIDDQIFSILGSNSSSVLRVGDVIQVQRMVQKTVQVPVQDARTKHLIHLLATNYKKLFTKYPKLYDQMDSRLSQFFSQQLIDVMEVDQLDRIVQVVKYVPQVVKVQNVYAYSNEKSRKVEFHLRVLIKALLEQMEKIKAKTGQTYQIDQGVIGMIKQQIMDVVDVDDILKVYRVTPKIVQVEKIVQKIVDRIIQVPKIVEVQRRVQTPVQVKRYQVVQNTINVPVQVPRLQTLIVQKLVQVPRIEQKIIEVPKIIEKIVQVIRQVPKIVQVERIVQRFIQVEKIRQIQKEIVVPVTQYRDVQFLRDKIVTTQQIVQKSVPVDQYIEKIVPVRQIIQKIVQVEKIVEKIVEVPKYFSVPQIHNHIETRQRPVEIVKQKIVPVHKYVQKIVQVPQIVEKIVQVHSIIEKPVQVQVMVEKIVYRDRIKQVQKVVEKPVVEYKTIQKIVEKFIQVPLIQQIIKVQRQIIQKPVVEIVQRIIHKQIQIQKPKVLYQDRIKQVDKIVNHFIKEPQIIHITQQRIVPVEKVIERIKSVPTIVQKLIQKMVQVPKVVQVQKIVQKIVVVPRVIQKVVEVPQIVQKIVERIQVVNQIHEIQKIVQVPVIQQRIVEVQVPRNIYIQVQRPVDVVRQVLVRDQIYKQNTKIQQMISQRVVVQNRQIPRTLQVEKIITHIVQQPKLIQINRDIIVPVQIQVPVDRIVQKMVPIEVVHRQVEQVDKIIQKIVAVQTQIQIPVEVQRIIQVPIIQERIKEVQKIIPYIQDRVVEVERLVQKIVGIQKTNTQIQIVPQIVQKVVDRVAEIPKIYEIQKIVQKRVDVPRIIQVERVVPEIIQVNKYIQKIVEKIIQIPVLVQQLRQIQVERQKIIAVRTQNTNIKQVDKLIQKQVIIQKLKAATNNIHLIEQTLQMVDRIIQKNMDPVLLSQQKIIQVPHIIEKIVQKIVVMPQIVQVLKYVHEISQKQSLGVAVSGEIGLEQRRYKDMGNNLKGQLEGLILELRRVKNTNPSVRTQIQLLEKFLSEYQTFLLFPRIQQIVKKEEVQRVVQRDRPVLVPYESESNLRMELSKAILIQKLITELKNIKSQNPNIKFNNLDDDINLIFFPELGVSSRNAPQGFNKQLQQFTNSVQRKFVQMGGWSTDHQIMLNSFLQQRFLIANMVKNSNETIRKTKAISQKRLQQLRKANQKCENLSQALLNSRQIMTSILELPEIKKNPKTQRNIKDTLQSIMALVTSQFFKGQPTKRLGQIALDARIQSMIRQKDNLIIELKDRLRNQGNSSRDVALYQSRIKQLQLQKLRIQTTHNRCADQKRRYIDEIEILRSKIKQLQGQFRSARTILSPKQSINTRNSLTSPNAQQKRIQTRVQVSRRSQKSQSDSSSYGVNYHNYANEDQDYNGIQIVKSTYQTVNGKTLFTGSEAGSIGRVGSQQYLLGTDSRSREVDNNQLGGGRNVYQKMQMSSVSSTNGGNTLSNTTGKKYQTYYQSKYQER